MAQVMIFFVKGSKSGMGEIMSSQGARFRPLDFAHIYRKGFSSVAIIAAIRALTVRAFDLLIFLSFVTPVCKIMNLLIF